MTLASAAFGFGHHVAKLDVSGRSFGAGPGPMVDKNLAYTNSEALGTT